MVGGGEEGTGCAEALGAEFVDGVVGLGKGAALTEFCVCGQRRVGTMEGVWVDVVSGTSQVVEVEHITKKAIVNVPLPQPCSTRERLQECTKSIRHKRYLAKSQLKIDVALGGHASCLTDFVQYHRRPRGKHDPGRAPKVCLTLSTAKLQEVASQSACWTSVIYKKSWPEDLLPLAS